MMRRQRRGAAAIEFVLTMSAGILLIFGMIELSRFQETGVMVTAAAQDAVTAGAHILETSNPATVFLAALGAVLGHSLKSYTPDTRSLTHSLTHSLAHSLAHSLTHALTHALTHSHTDSLTH